MDIKVENFEPLQIQTKIDLKIQDKNYVNIIMSDNSNYNNNN